MNRRTTGRALALALLAAVPLPAPAQVPPPGKPPELVASTGPQSPEQERAGFHLPPGFEAQLVACEPDIHKPMNLAFDDLGRLWVTSSLEYPFPAKEGTTPRDAVKVLSDFGPDGRARKVETFADGLNIPIGILPLTPTEALVHSIPRVWRFADTDGDGRADRRAEAYESYGFNDTHGMTNAFTLGFDGWVYACHGFSNTSTVRGQDGQAITMQSGNTYRMRPDGSHLEWFTHGQVNPFGIAVDPLGNLFTCDCHSRPIYQLLRGAYYPSFGKPDDGLGFGPEMMSHDHGSTGIAGIVYYDADHFPAAYRDRVLIGNVVTSRINQDTLEPHGSTLKAIVQPDFMASDDPWFRPVDIKLGPDGALYVADFYNKIIGHYEVPLTHPERDRERGRIWRIVYKGDEPHAEPKSPLDDWTRASVDELIAALSHPNLAVRLRATNQLVRRGGNEVIEKASRAAESDSPRARAHAAWVLDRLGALGAFFLAGAVVDADPLVRVHAQRILAERPTWTDGQHEFAVKALKDDDAFVRRVAADGLGRHPSAANLRPLLDLRHAVPDDDTHLLHVARMALRDQLAGKSAWQAVESTAWDERDGRALADVALGVPGNESARFLLAALRKWPPAGDPLIRTVHHIARNGDDPAALLSFLKESRPDDLGHQSALLRAVQQGAQERGQPLDEPTRAWAADRIGRMLDSGQAGVVMASIELAASIKVEGLGDRLRSLASKADGDAGARVAALKSLVALDPSAGRELAGRALADAAEPVALREQAAVLLGKGPEARAALLTALPAAPGKLQTVIAVVLAGSREGAEALLDAIAAGKASARLLQERFVEVQLRSSGVPKVDERLASLLSDLPPADSKIQEVIARRRAAFASATPDVDRGAQVFTKNCAACHQIGGQGAKIGPQLDGIGARGADRLTEDILDPSRNIDQAFRVTTLALKDGQVVSGLLLREEGEVLVLADTQGKEVRIDRANVDDRKLAPISPMPAGLADQIGEEDFSHLLGFLLSRPKAPEPKP